MSKRKKSYDRAEYENNYYNNRLIDSNYVGNNFNPYLNTKFQFNNFNDIYNNLNNIMDVLIKRIIYLMKFIIKMK